MPPKRQSSRDLTSKTPKTMQKISESNETNDELKQFNVDIENALIAKDDARLLQLSAKFIKMHTSLSNIATQLLTYYIEANNQQQVRELLKHQNLDFKTPAAGSGLLWKAVSNGKLELAEMLVRAGADLSIRESNGNKTFLHDVLSNNEIKDREKIEKLASLMLEYGADVNALDMYGYSILHRAIRNETISSAFVEKLLQRGANVRIEKGLNDIDSAVQHKPHLLLKLIEHQSPDVETRNKRGTIAIESLLSIKNARNQDVIKKILDLGIPVNNPDPRSPIGHKSCSLLHSALRAKKIDVIKLLLDYGANVQEKDDYGSTPLYEAAMRFKGYSDASRLLISRGASINKRNDDGQYPIHGACRNESLRNAHLFLSLGANLAVTDTKGKTPFERMTTAGVSLTDAGRLVVKHLALMTSKGMSIIDKDLKKINAFWDVCAFYNQCLDELELMKTEKMYKDIPYFSLLSDNINDLLLLVKDEDFIETINENSSFMSDKFSIYYFNLTTPCVIALKKLKILEDMKKLIMKVFKEIFPKAVIDKIAYYASLKKMINCEKAHYLTLHENSKHNAIDKRKLI